MDLLSSLGINLPPVVFAHSLFFICLGLRDLLSLPKKNAPPYHDVKGILYLAIGVSYIVTCYVPLEENQIVYASVPVRLGVAAIAALRLLLVPRQSKEWRREMWIVIMYDGIGASLIGWELGVWNGRVPGR